MKITLAFDVYGTLIDTAGVITALEELAGVRAAELSQLWRWKQLEYSFRRALMQNYRDFRVCTRQALDYACRVLGVEIPPEERKKLLAGYRTLPPFPEVDEGLARLKNAGFRMFAFSNGHPADVRALLANARLESYFTGIVSTNEVRSFKPNPVVYAHFLRRSESAGSEAWLVSSNPFDVIGAISAGLRAAWVKRSPEMVFDPWEIEPTITVSSVSELREALPEGGGAT